MAETDLRFVIRADSKQGEAAVRKMTTSMKDMGREAGKQTKAGTKSFGTFEKSISSVKKIALGFGVAFGAMQIAQIMKSWIDEVLDFEREFANVSTLLDTTRTPVIQMRKDVLALGGELGSSTQLTRGLYQTLSAGVEPAQAVKFVGEAAMFATAALTDTFTAVDVLTTVINAYGLAATDATKVSDLLFEIIKQGKTTGQELATALGTIIPTAATLGVGLEEVGAALATMTKGGISTDEAVTALNRALLTFLVPSEQATKLAKEMGVELSLASLKSKGLFESLKELARATEGNAEATATFFNNVRALKAVLVLTGAQADEFERILGTMFDTTGNITTAFEKQTDTISKQLSAAWNNLTRIIATIGQKAGFVTTALKGVNKVLDLEQKVLSGANGLVFWWKKYLPAIALVTDKLPDTALQTNNLSDSMNFLARDQQAATDEMIRQIQQMTVGGGVIQGYKHAQIALTDELKKFIRASQDAIDPSAALTNKIMALEDAGFNTKQIMFLLSDEMRAAIEIHKELGTAVSPLVAKYNTLSSEGKSFAEISRDVNAAMEDFLGKAKSSVIWMKALAVASAKQRGELGMTNRAWQQYGDIISKDAIEGTLKLIEAFNAEAAAQAAARRQMENAISVVDQFDAEMADLEEQTRSNAASARDWSEVWKRQVSTVVTDFSAGVADMILEGKSFSSILKGIFKEVARAVIRILVEDLVTVGIQVLKDFGTSILGAFKSIFTGGGGGGGGTGGGGTTPIPTANFTKLAITGVAIQTGIFGTGVAVTGVTIQTGEFHTGVSFSGITLTFGGGAGDRLKGIHDELIRIKHFQFERLPWIEWNNAVLWIIRNHLLDIRNVEWDNLWKMTAFLRQINITLFEIRDSIRLMQRQVEFSVVKSFPGQNVPRAQGGGIVTETGAAIVHRGETIEPAEISVPRMARTPEVHIHLENAQIFGIEDLEETFSQAWADAASRGAFTQFGVQ